MSSASMGRDGGSILGRRCELNRVKTKANPGKLLFLERQWAECRGWDAKGGLESGWRRLDLAC